MLHLTRRKASRKNHHTIRDIFVLDPDGGTAITYPKNVFFFFTDSNYFFLITPITWSFTHGKPAEVRK